MAYVHVKATVGDYDTWKSAFEGYHTLRAEYGGVEYELYQSADDPNEIVVVIEFDTVENARAWNDYLKSEGELAEPKMSDVEVSYLEMVEQRRLSAV